MCALNIASFVISPFSLSNMTQYREDFLICYFHPRETLVGVCALCLNEKLLILASKQEQELLHQPRSTHRSYSSSQRRSPINFPKIFALSSLLNRLDLRHRKSEDQCSGASTSQEDSFITIKFEDNGAATWEKNTISKVSLKHYDLSPQQRLSKEVQGGAKAVVEVAKPRGTLRWRKRIGHLFQLTRSKRPGKGNVSHVGSKLEGVKVRHGWIRILTRKRTKE